MTEKVVKDKPIQVRTSEKDRKLAAALVKKKVADSTSDAFRLGLRALARENGIKAPA